MVLPLLRRGRCCRFDCCKGRLDACYLREINIPLYLFLSRRLEIKLFETIAVEHHDPRLFGVSGVDEHAFCHSGVTPRRASSAWRKSADGAILCARKPAAPAAIPSSNDWRLAMGGLVSEPLPASGSYDRRRPALRRAAAAALLPTMRSGFASPYRARRPVGRRRFLATLNV